MRHPGRRLAVWNVERPQRMSRFTGELVLSHLARATVELGDLATDHARDDAMLRIGNGTSSPRPPTTPTF